MGCVARLVPKQVSLFPLEMCNCVNTQLPFCYIAVFTFIFTFLIHGKVIDGNHYIGGVIGVRASGTHPNPVVRN